MRLEGKFLHKKERRRTVTFLDGAWTARHDKNLEAMLRTGAYCSTTSFVAGWQNPNALGHIASIHTCSSNFWATLPMGSFRTLALC